MTLLGTEMTEAEWQAQVLDFAHLAGWRVAHFRPAGTEKGWRTPVAADGAGFPDLVLVRGRRLIFVELKSETGKLRSEQEDWLAALDKSDAEVHIWRPSDFEEMISTLQRDVRL